jgi:hypothetical protein
MKLLTCNLKTLCSCPCLHLNFLVIVLGFFGLLLAMGFMVCGKCHHKASWLMKMNSE